ncbi:MAG TPA: RluA family pseudouridine synthase [Dehalococcoidia bacterium]|nr:RluA family pseudouridine synthase [Dehalococcoidia bacterium]
MAALTTADREIEVVADTPGERLDVAVARLCDLSRAQAHRLIDEGLVRVDGVVRIKAGDRLTGGERLCLTLAAPVPAEPQPESIPLTIVFEDEHLIVVDKPAGMPVHPGPGHSGHTLVNALLAHCPDLPGIGGVQRPGIVHRLDKDTSGLIVAAKDERAHQGLTRQLAERLMHKTYLALVEGRLTPPEALIDAPLARDPNNRKRMMIRASNGREAQTRYRVREVYHLRPEHVEAQVSELTCVEASPITGRTHQIRVHLASLSHPIVGDVIYGRASKLVGRQFLHAWRLTLHHPISGAELSFEAPLASDLAAALRELQAKT